MAKDVDILTNNGVDVKKSLELFGDINTYNETLGELLTALKEKIPQLENYRKIGDMANYAILVHSLKSDARYFGFMDLGEIAYQHELKSKDNDISFVNNNFDALVKEAYKSENIVKQYLGMMPVSTNNVETTKPKENSKVNNAIILNEKTFLVADDSNIVRKFIEKVFKDHISVAVAENGEEVIDMIEANPDYITGILLDLNMPIVDGFKVLEYFQDNDLFKKIPVSIITGESSKTAIDKAYKYPIVDILPKPFNEKDVKRVVEKTIDFVTWSS